MKQETYRLAKLTLLLIAIGASIIFAYLFLLQGYEVINSYVCSGRSVIVQQGDTLFDLVRSECSGNLDKALDDLYAQYGSYLREGQQIKFPMNYGGK